MARIRDIQRTAAFAWSPEAAPFIATGTQAGAVSADFSDNTVLELWDLDLENAQSGGELSPVASIATDSKCVTHLELPPARPPGGLSREKAYYSLIN